MDGDLALYGAISKNAPQDPFLPRESSYGPSFLDSSACLCALQQVGARNDGAAWQCIGNQTQGVYEVTTGKWFESLHGGNKINLPIYDASNGPDTKKALKWDKNKGVFLDANLKQLTPYDRACTGRNQTTFSTAFYRAVAEKEAGDTLFDAAPCWREGGIPVEIQDVASWTSTGCPLGFLCSFCPPDYLY